MYTHRRTALLNIWNRPFENSLVSKTLVSVWRSYADIPNILNRTFKPEVRLTTSEPVEFPNDTAILQGTTRQSTTSTMKPSTKLNRFELIFIDILSSSDLRYFLRFAKLLKVDVTARIIWFGLCCVVCTNRLMFCWISNFYETAHSRFVYICTATSTYSALSLSHSLFPYILVCRMPSKYWICL